MKQAMSDTVLLWVLLTVLAIIYTAAAVNIDLPLLARTTFWRLEQNPGIGMAISAVVVITVLIMGLAQESKCSKRLFIAGLYMGLGIVSLIFFDPGTGMAFVATSLGIYRRYKNASHNLAFDTDVPPVRRST